MAAGIAIRIARREEMGLVHAMLEELAAATGRAGAIRGSPADLVRHGCGEHPLFTAYLAARAGKDVGMLLCFAEYSSWRGKRGVYVQDLYVAPAYRGAGIARALLARAAQGGEYLRLAIAADNEAAARFYEAAGFTKAHDERIFAAEGAALAVLRQRD